MLICVNTKNNIFIKKETKINYFPLLYIKWKPNFEKIDNFCKSLWLTEIFIFTPKLDWFIQYVAYENETTSSNPRKELRKKEEGVNLNSFPYFCA